MPEVVVGSLDFGNASKFGLERLFPGGVLFLLRFFGLGLRLNEGALINHGHHGLHLLHDPFLGLVVGDKKLNLALDAHLRPRTHIQLQFLITADPQILDRKLSLYFHLPEIADKHGEFIRQFFRDEFFSHGPDIVGLTLVLGPEVGIDAVGDKLEVVEERVLLLNDAGHFDDGLVDDHLRFLQHFDLLLPHGFPRCELLGLLHLPPRVTHAEGVPALLHRKDCLLHSTTRLYKLLK